MNAQPGNSDSDKSKKQQFADTAEEAQMGFFAEFWDFLIHNKKWWITPIILVLLCFGLLIVLQGTVAAPFIYTLF